MAWYEYIFWGYLGFAAVLIFAQASEFVIDRLAGDDPEDDEDYIPLTYHQDPCFCEICREHA